MTWCSPCAWHSGLPASRRLRWTSRWRPPPVMRLARKICTLGTTAPVGSDDEARHAHPSYEGHHVRTPSRGRPSCPATAGVPSFASTNYDLTPLASLRAPQRGVVARLRANLAWHWPLFADRPEPRRRTRAVPRSTAVGLLNERVVPQARVSVYLHRGDYLVFLLRC